MDTTLKRERQLINFSNKLKTLAFTGALCLLQACASPAPRECDRSTDCAEQSSNAELGASTLGVTTFQPEMVIATDLVNALMQIPSYDKSKTIIRIPNSTSNFMSAVRDVLIKRGYRIQQSANRTGRGVLMVSTAKVTSANSMFTYMIAVDRLAMKRTYLIENRMVAPVSSLFVRGISPSLVTLNDGLFVE